MGERTSEAITIISNLKSQDIKISTKGWVNKAQDGIANINLESFFDTLKENVIRFLICVIVGVVGGALLPLALFLVLCAMGFTLGGVAAASLAAGCQGPMTAVGSCFACLQSIAASGVLLAAAPPFGIAGGVAGIAYYVASIFVID